MMKEYYSRLRRQHNLAREDREPQWDRAALVRDWRRMCLLVVDAEGGRGPGAREPVDGDPGEDWGGLAVDPVTEEMTERSVYGLSNVATRDAALLL